MPITPLRRNSARSVALSTMTSATRPEKSMSLAPIDSSTRSSVRSGWRRFRRGQRLAQFGELGVARVPGQLAGFRSAGIRARAAVPNSPSAMVAPVQASGR